LLNESHIPSDGAGRRRKIYPTNHNYLVHDPRRAESVYTRDRREESKWRSKG
jgi:hypothetical protein